MSTNKRDGRRTALLVTLEEKIKVFRGAGHTNPKIQALLEAANAAVSDNSVKPLRTWQKEVGGSQSAQQLLLEYTRSGATHGVAETVYDLLSSYRS